MQSSYRNKCTEIKWTKSFENCSVFSFSFFSFFFLLHLTNGTERNVYFLKKKVPSLYIVVPKLLTWVNYPVVQFVSIFQLLCPVFCSRLKPKAVPMFPGIYKPLQSVAYKELHWDLDRMADIIHFDLQLLVILEETLQQNKSHSILLFSYTEQKRYIWDRWNLISMRYVLDVL